MQQKSEDIKWQKRSIATIPRLHLEQAKNEQQHLTMYSLQRYKKAQQC